LEANFTLKRRLLAHFPQITPTENKASRGRTYKGRRNGAAAPRLWNTLYNWFYSLYSKDGQLRASLRHQPLVAINLLYSNWTRVKGLLTLLGHLLIVFPWRHPTITQRLGGRVNHPALFFFWDSPFFGRTTLPTVGGIAWPDGTRSKAATDRAVTSRTRESARSRGRRPPWAPYPAKYAATGFREPAFRTARSGSWLHQSVFSTLATKKDSSTTELI